MRRLAPVEALGTAAKGPASNDLGVWNDVSNLWPTASGSYASCEQYQAASAKTATGEAAASERYAFVASISNADNAVAWLVGAKIWLVGSLLSLTDRTNGVSINSYPMMAQFGNVTICALNPFSTVASTTGGNFAALAGAPKAEIALTCANAAILLNVDDGVAVRTSGWYASDIGDYTNWTTGEAANGDLFQTSGSVVAGVTYQEAVYAFKRDSILRGRYVGGIVKWAWEVCQRGIGVGALAATRKYCAVATNHGIAFISAQGDGATGDGAGMIVHLYDGANAPTPLNPDTYLAPIASSSVPFLLYDAVLDMLIIQSNSTDAPLFYRFASGRWGRGAALASGVPVCGSRSDRSIANAYSSTAQYALPPRWAGGTNVMNYYGPVYADSSSVTAYVETALVGDDKTKSTFTRAIPVVRRRSGSPTATLIYTTYRELDGSGAGTPTTVSESSLRHRFDFRATDNFIKLKLQFVGGAVDIDDIDVSSARAGTD